MSAGPSRDIPRDGAELSRRLFGTDEPVPPTVILSAGPVDVNYRAGKLGAIRLGATEIWHGVTFTFRDPDWGTPDPQILKETVQATPDAFRVDVTGVFPTVPLIDFTLSIEGDRDGRIRFAGEARPRGEILTNRLGLCVLHPMLAGGRRVVVGHVDGRRSDSTWPMLVPAWPPFTLVRSIRHEYADGAWASCDLVGDVFEVEDQRNNSDPSFKTYGRSNMMPRPYQLDGEAVIRHSAELQVEGRSPRVAPTRDEGAVTVRFGRDDHAIPRLGVAISAADAAEPDAVAGALSSLRPAYLHLTLWPDMPAPDWDGVGTLLAAAAADLRIDVVCAGIAEQTVALSGLREALRDCGLRPESLAVFPCDGAAIDRARRIFPTVRIGGGTPHYFAQLNRLERMGPVDFVGFTSSPLVHGAEDDAVMLSLQSLPSLVDTIRARHPGVRVRIGPSAIGVRRSPLGRQPETDGTRRLALAGRDPRSRALFGAAWALGYVAGAARAGAETVTLGSLTGDTGLTGTGQDGRVKPLPAAAVLSRLWERPAQAWEVAVSRPEAVAALALGRSGGRELLVANLTGRTLDLTLEGWRPDSVAILDAGSIARASGGRAFWDNERRAHASPTLTLSPYAIASLQGCP